MGKRNAFTLIELLVVIAIIAVLAAVLFPVFIAAKQQANKALCADNLKQLGVAMMMYCQDNNDTFVPWFNGGYVDQQGVTHDWGTWAHYQFLIRRYVKNDKVFQCPSDTGVPGAGWTKGTDPMWKFNRAYGYRYNYCFTSYFFNGWIWSTDTGDLSGVKAGTVRLPTWTVMLYEAAFTGPQSWHQQVMRTLQDCMSNVCYVDGHVRYTLAYLDTAKWSWHVDPPGRYHYKYSPW